METPQPTTPATAIDPWLARADELRARMEALLEIQLHEYELMNAKLAGWKLDPAAGHLTVNDYEPWQTALKKLEHAHREFDAHMATRTAEAPSDPT